MIGPFFKAPPPGNKPVKAATLMADTTDGGTLSRPIQPYDTPAPSEINTVQQYLNSRWNYGIVNGEPVITIPWAFQAAIIGPRSQFAYVGIIVQGRKPFVIGPGNPIIGDFPANSTMIPYYRYINNAGGLLEVLFWPKEPNSEFPGGRAPFSRLINNNVAVNPEIDSTGAISQPWFFICENRKTLTVSGDPNGTSNLVPVWFFSPVYNFENPSIQTTLQGPFVVDQQVFPNAAQAALSERSPSSFTMQWDVPVGATGVLMEDVSGLTVFSDSGQFNITLSGEYNT